jgi:hypothetical protein
MQLKNIAFARTFQLIEFFLIARDQAALHAQISNGAGELGLGRLQILLRRADIALRAGQIRAH